MAKASSISYFSEYFSENFSESGNFSGVFFSLKQNPLLACFGHSLILDVSSHIPVLAATKEIPRRFLRNLSEGTSLLMTSEMLPNKLRQKCQLSKYVRNTAQQGMRVRQKY